MEVPFSVTNQIVAVPTIPELNERLVGLDEDDWQVEAVEARRWLGEAKRL